MQNLSFIIFFLVSFILEINVDIFTIFEVSPNFLLIITAIASLRLTPLKGGFFGFILGLVTDSIGIRRLGINSLSFSLIGILVSIFRDKIYYRRMDVLFALVFVSTMVYKSISLILLLILEGYFLNPLHILKEGLYNGIIGSCLFFVIKKGYEKKAFLS